MRTMAVIVVARFDPADKADIFVDAQVGVTQINGRVIASLSGCQQFQ